MKPRMSQRIQFSLAYLLVAVIVLSFLQSWMLAIWMFLMRRVGGGPTQALSFGRSKHKIFDRKELKTTFADVAGVDEAKAELVEIVDFLKNPRKYQRLGGRIPKGVLLVGPPGTGKTLLRPGRFDRQVVVDKPDIRGREAILRLHARAVVLAPNVELGVIAARTPGFAGADLANIVNEAALLAARKEKNAVEMSDFEEAIDRMVAGLEKKSRVLSEKERDIVAHHEMGHAFVAATVAHADPVHKVTIIPRGIAALGMTYQLPTEDRFLLTRSEIEDRIAVLLGGRVAEELVYGEVSTGAHNDLERASELARLMVTKYGMSERIGLVSFGDNSPLFLKGSGFGGERDYSEATARTIDEEVRAILDRTHDRVRGLLTTKKSALVAAATELKRVETLEGEPLRRLLNGDAAGTNASRRAPLT